MFLPNPRFPDHLISEIILDRYVGHWQFYKLSQSFQQSAHSQFRLATVQLCNHNCALTLLKCKIQHGRDPSQKGLLPVRNGAMIKHVRFPPSGMKAVVLGATLQKNYQVA